MVFVYHGVPSEIVGDVLYPLNQLATIAPEAYELQRSKYLGREAVLDARISPEGLLFNDTVHCAPLHPVGCTNSAVSANSSICSGIVFCAPHAPFRRSDISAKRDKHGRRTLAQVGGWVYHPGCADHGARLG
jgi:hypothetical protein